MWYNNSVEREVIKMANDKIIKCPNCHEDNSTVIDYEQHYDYSFTCLNCNSCGKNWTIEYDNLGRAVSVQIKKEDGKIYTYDLQGNLILVI
jgi:transposase-like protein